MNTNNTELISMMNESRWKSVYSNFQSEELPFLYRLKTIDGEFFPQSVNELRFDCREVFPEKFKVVEWLEIHSFEKTKTGKLIPPQINDHTDLAIEIARQSKARYIKTDYGIKIVGYVKRSEVESVQK